MITISSREVGKDVVVEPSGRLDMVGAGPVRKAVTELVGDGRRLVVDLDAVEFLDSSGLGALIACLKSARQAGGDLRIARPNEQVMLVLQLTSMDTVLRPWGSVEDALAS